MDDPNSDAQCAMCAVDQAAKDVDVLFENELWILRSGPIGRGLPGWLLLQSRRHTAGIDDFNDVEAADFGVLMRHLQQTLRDVTGALRIYIASMNELVPHFHCHLVPRYEQMPVGVSGFGVFGLLGASYAGPFEGQTAQAARINTDLSVALKNSPPSAFTHRHER